MTLPQFQATPVQRPPTGATAASVVGLFAMCTVAGGLVGLAAGGVKHFYWLVLLFPLFFGALAATGCFAAILLTKTHGRALATAAGLWAGLAAGIAMHGVLNHDNCGSDGLAPRTFARCLDFRAQTGVTLKHGDHRGRNQDGVKHDNVLTPAMTYAYWGLELLLITLLPVVTAYTTAAEPFCGWCRGWMPPRHIGALRGPRSPLVAALRTGDLDPLKTASPHRRADEKAFPQRLQTDDLALSMWACPRCGIASPIVLRLYIGGPGPKPMAVLAAEAQYPGDAIPVVEQLFPEG